MTDPLNTALEAFRAEKASVRTRIRELKVQLKNEEKRLADVTALEQSTASLASGRLRATRHHRGRVAHHSDEVTNSSQSERVIQLMTAKPDKTWTTKDIAAEASIPVLDSARKLLHRLVTAGAVIRRPDGTWTLAAAGPTSHT